MYAKVIGHYLHWSSVGRLVLYRYKSSAPLHLVALCSPSNDHYIHPTCSCWMTTATAFTLRVKATPIWAISMGCGRTNEFDRRRACYLRYAVRSRQRRSACSRRQVHATWTWRGWRKDSILSAARFPTFRKDLEAIISTEWSVKVASWEKAAVGGRSPITISQLKIV